MLDMDVMIDSHQENVSFKGDVGTKRGLRKRSLQGSVPVHKPNTNNQSPRGACTHPIRFIEGDAKNLDFCFQSKRPILNVPGTTGAKFSEKYRFWQYHGEHTGFSS